MKNIQYSQDSLRRKIVRLSKFPYILKDSIGRQTISIEIFIEHYSNANLYKGTSGKKFLDRLGDTGISVMISSTVRLGGRSPWLGAT